jgi:acetyl esterase
VNNDIPKPPGLSSVSDENWSRLHPAAAESIAAGHAAGRPNAHLLSVADARARFDADMSTLTRPTVHQLTEEILEWDGHQVSARRYEAAKTTDAEPVFVYFHGGGWLIGSLDAADVACRELCLATNAIVISVDYRLAPEWQFPAAVDDAVTAVRAVATGYPGRRLVVAGDSAGGNLATVAAIQLRDVGESIIDRQLLIYPVTTCDLAIGFDSAFEGIALYRDEMQWHQDNYLPDPELATDPRVAPLEADLPDLPPVTMVLAECDPITPQGQLYAEALRRAGVGVDVRRFEHMFHGFFGLDQLIPQASQAMDWIARSL